MPFTSNPPRLRSEAVHDRLRREILSGQYAPGDALPSERALSEAHRVNRHAVREAIKRLQQAGLVQVAQGGATRVLDWRVTGGLDLLADLATTEELAPLLRAVGEMRASIGADAARLCALRGPADLRASLPAMARALPDPADVRRFETRFRAYEAFWAKIVEGSGNLTYRLAFNSLVTARDAGGIDTALYVAEVDDARAVAVPLAVAIADADTDVAFALARDLLDRAVAATPEDGAGR
jgi:GntR family transcriptional repressor for pyruvate dehydrogenase complex